MCWGESIVNRVLIVNRSPDERAVQIWCGKRGEERGTGTAGVSAGDRISGRPRCCRWLRYMTVRHHWDAFLCLSWLAGAGGIRGLCRLWTAFAGDAGTSFRWLREGLSGVRRGARKGPRRSCIFSESVALLFFGLLTRVKKGEKCAKRNAPMGCNTSVKKIGGN